VLSSTRERSAITGATFAKKMSPPRITYVIKIVISTLAVAPA